MEIISWDSVEEEDLGGGIFRKLFHGENIMVVKWRLAPKARIPLHEHVSEQVTMVESGSILFTFPEDEQIQLGPGGMLVIAPNRPHAVEVGPEGCEVTDLFSPIREDFLRKSAEVSSRPDLTGEGASEVTDQEAAYQEFWALLREKGVRVDMEQFRQLPLELAARYTYDRECISMGRMRRLLGLDKAQAKALIRKWKHGDDHSEYSLQRMHQRLVILPGDPIPRKGKG